MVRQWVRERLEGLLDSVLGVICVSLGVAMLMIFALAWNAVQKASGTMAPLILGYLFIFVFFGTVMLLNQVGEIVDRRTRHAEARQRKRQPPTPADIEHRVRQWLDNRRFSITNNPHSECDFRLEIREPLTGRLFSILKRTTESDITLGVNFLISPADWTNVDALVSQPTSTLVDDICIALVQYGLSYLTPGLPLRTVLLEEQFPFDETFTEFEFRKHVKHLLGGILLLERFLARASRQNPTQTPSSS